MQVTEHFDSGEFDQRRWSGGPSLTYPAEWLEPRLRPLCEALEIIRAELGVPLKILSGYRSEAMNRSIGGARLSQHVQGKAADIKAAKGIAAADVHAVVLRLCREGRLPMVRGLGSYVGFVHVDVRTSPRLVRWGGSRDTN